MSKFYILENKDEGPRYVHTMAGSPIIVRAGGKSEPVQISDVEIEAAAESVNHNGDPIWAIEEAEAPKADKVEQAKPLAKMNRDELLAEAAKPREAGQTIEFTDDATKAVILKAIEAAPPVEGGE